MVRLWKLPALCVLLVTACDSAETTSGGAGGVGGSGGMGGAGGAGAVLPPSLFDCSRTSEPERINKIPIGCATDRTCRQVLVSGHRGAGGLAPEDTVAGVRAAIALGIDYVETDPRPTKDGYLVNVHDTSVDRTTFGTGEVADMTLAEIQSLELKTFDLPGDFSCERIPTLEQILTAARGKVHVLIDANKTDRVDLLVAAVQATDTLDWAIFDTSSVDKIDQALAIEPNLFTMIRVESPEQLATQLEHFADHPPVIVEVDEGSVEMLDAVHAAGHRALLDLFVIDVAVSFSGDLSAYEPNFANGLDIGQTDRPDFVLQYLGRFPEL